jgi:DNA-directed RNA polymerase alpha subunit
MTVEKIYLFEGEVIDGKTIIDTMQALIDVQQRLIAELEALRKGLPVRYRDEEIINSSLNILLYDFRTCLTNRSDNCLKSAFEGVENPTLKTLIEFGESNVKAIKNLGQKSFKEITDELQKLGLYWS